MKSTEKIKVAFLSFYSGSVERGVEVFTHELATRLAERHDVTVFQGGPAEPETAYRVVKVNLAVDVTKPASSGVVRKAFLDYFSRRIFLFTLKTLWPLFSGRYNVVVALNGGWQSFLVRIITWLYGGKLIIVGESGIGWDDRFNLYCQPNVFVGLTEYQSKWARGVNSQVQVVKIPNGVDTKVFKPDGENLKLSVKSPVILSVGAFTPIKRLDLAIKAVAKIRDASLVLVGSGEMEQQLKTLGHELLGDKFLILQLSHGEMRKVYKSADVFTYPTSAWESFGISMLEALASNLPVVATDDPIRREIVGEAGLFVDPTDPDAYAQALVEAMDTRWRNKPREQAQRFSWDEISKKYEQLFLEIAGRGENS